MSYKKGQTYKKKILKKFQFLLDEGAIAELKYLEEVNRENEIIGKIIDNQKDLQRRKLILEQDIKIIDAELSALLAKKTEAKVLLDYKSLKSPVDGLVFDLKPTSSGFVAQSSQPIMKIVPFNNLEADIKIPSSKIGFVKQRYKCRSCWIDSISRHRWHTRHQPWCWYIV